MRAPFQILAIPYKMIDGKFFYCVFRRADQDRWQFIAGGGEDDETPIQAAQREICEESGIHARNIISLRSVCSVPTDIFPNKHLYNWAADTYVVPEYSFGFECTGAVNLSHEHVEYVWLTYEEACSKLTWDSNRTALYELDCRLKEHCGITKISYATMDDYDLLVSKDIHIKKEEWKKLIENAQALIFYADGNFAGWLRYNLFWSEIPFMNMLYFLEEYRGRGYGTQMVSFWEKEMIKLGYDKVMTSSQANESAQHFYRKLGYRDSGSFFPFCNDLEIIFTKEL